jgi:hypothetical protein
MQSVARYRWWRALLSRTVRLLLLWAHDAALSRLVQFGLTLESRRCYLAVVGYFSGLDPLGGQENLAAFPSRQGTLRRGHHAMMARLQASCWKLEQREGWCRRRHQPSADLFACPPVTTIAWTVNTAAVGMQCCPPAAPGTVVLEESLS